MNQDDFEAKLTEAAHWCIEPVSISGNAKCLPPVDEWDDRWDYDEEDSPNVSKTIRIQQIKHIEKQCSDCERIITDRTVIAKRYDSPKPHFKSRCLVCNNYKNPWTGDFDIDPKDVYQAYQFWSRNEKGIHCDSKFLKFIKKANEK